MQGQATQNGITKLDKCLPCTSPAAVECSCYIASWHGKLATYSIQTYFSLPFAPLTRNKKIQLASKIVTSWTLLLKEEKGWTNWHKSCVSPFHTVKQGQSHQNLSGRVTFALSCPHALYPLSFQSINMGRICPYSRFGNLKDNG